MASTLTESACYASFREIVKAIHTCSTAEDIASLLVCKLTRAFGALGSLIQLYDPAQQGLALNIFYGFSRITGLEQPVVAPEWLAEFSGQQKIWVIEDLLNDPRLPEAGTLWRSGVRLLALVPLLVREKYPGFLGVGLARQRQLTPLELEFLAAVAQQCGCALDKAYLIAQQEQQFQQLARQTERLTALGRLAAGVTHELNNPLSSILLFSSNLRKKATDSFFQEGLDIIIQETKRCKAIIQELQEFSRSKEPKKTVGNINQILAKVLNLLESEFRKSRIRLIRELAAHLPNMLLDIGQMQQVFVNLLLNAIEAVKSGGEIRVSTRYVPERRLVEVEVADTGPGIPAAYLPRLFEPFFSTKPKGTGLGLAVTYSFVLNHQGDIQVHSRQGQGTSFTVQLPVNRLPATEA